MNQLFGKVALVTGASSGIGASLCKEFVKQGMAVVGCARNVQRIEELDKELSMTQYKGKLFPQKCDMSLEEDIFRMYDQIESQFGCLNVCVNNAITVIDSSLLNGRSPDWRYMLEVGIMGNLINTKEAYKLMRECCEDGHIIQMGSIVGYKIPRYFSTPPDVEPLPWLHVYYGMKWMTRALAEGYRQELRANHSNRIRLSVISPGAVETELLARCHSEKFADAFFKGHECLQPEDVVNTVLYVLNTPPHVYVHDVILEPLGFQMD